MLLVLKNVSEWDYVSGISLHGYRKSKRNSVIV